MRAYITKIAVLAVSLVASLFLVEFLLWALTKAGVLPSYKTESAGKFYDDKLGYRIPPFALPEIDANGFRNPSVPERADIVGIGDSMTYGYNALSQDSWVYELGRKTDLSVYSVSIGGGDPPQYLLLLDEALKLNPSAIVLGLYLGNDIAGSCYFTRELDFWRSYAEEKGIDVADCLNKSDDLWPEGQVPQDTKGEEQSFFSAVRGSYLVSFVKNIYPIKKAVWERRAKDLARESDDFYLVRDPAFDILFDYNRSRFIDRNHPAIRNSYEITKTLFSEMAKKLERNQKLFVVFIPTKENVFYDYLVQNNYAVPEVHRFFVEAQRSIVADLSDYFESIGIASVDTRPFLEKRIQSKNPPLYLEFNRDDHPTRVGYEAIAEAAAESFFLKER